LPRNDESSPRAGLLVIALGILAVLTWYGGADVIFALGASRSQAEISAWSVRLEPWAIYPGQSEVAAQTGIAPVPRVELRILEPMIGSCEASGRLAVFGLRKIESEQQMKNALASLQARGRVQAFVRERGGELECRLSRAMSPPFAIFWASMTLLTGAIAIWMWRAQRRRTVHGGDSR
jgi:hypothetical protein